MQAGTIFLDSINKRFGEYKILGEKALSQVSDKDLFFQPNEASNSIAVIIRHLHGNMKSRWTNFLTEDGEKDWRNRDDEFVNVQADREEIIRLWNEGWAIFLNQLAALREDDLLKTITIRNEPLTVIDAINRQLAHYSYHLGQIVYLARWFQDQAWQTLSIPKNASAAYNQKTMKSS